jgi:hypothetical protein
MEIKTKFNAGDQVLLLTDQSDCAKLSGFHEIKKVTIDCYWDTLGINGGVSYTLQCGVGEICNVKEESIFKEFPEAVKKLEEVLALRSKGNG